MNFKALVRYNMKDYLQSTKIILPIVTLVLLQLAVYTTSPIKLIDSVLMSCLYTFLIMIWIGYSYNGLEDIISQQLILLKSRHSVSYYLSQSVWLAILCVIISIGCSIVPLIANGVNFSHFFERNITGYDIVSFFILFLGTTLTGAFLGSLIHPRILTDKKLALVLVLLIAALCLTKEDIIAKNNYLAYVLWILPPIGKYVNFFMESNRLEIHTLGLFTLVMLVYSSIYLVIRTAILNRIKF